MCRFVGVCAAEGEGVVTVGFGWIVEGADIMSCFFVVIFMCCVSFYLLRQNKRELDGRKGNKGSKWIGE